MPYVLSPQVLPTALLAAGEYARPLLLRCPPTPPNAFPGEPLIPQRVTRGLLQAFSRPS